VKLFRLGYVPCLLAAAGFVAFGRVLVVKDRDYRASVETWATRDLLARTLLAAETLAEPLESGDFARVRTFASERLGQGARLTVLSAPGGMIFDTETRASGSHRTRPEVETARVAGEGTAIRLSGTTGEKMLYCARRTPSGAVVRLGIPYEQVVAPLARSRTALIVAGGVGGCGILLVFLVMELLIARNRKLSRERDAQRRVMAELQRVADFRRDFVANVSHEIKTPLTGILGAVEMLDAPDAESLPREDRQALMAMLRGAARRLDALAKDILSLARLERGEEDLRSRFAPTDLADVLRSARDAVAAEAQTRGVTLALGENLPTCVCPAEARLLEQALVNLIVNAVRHSGASVVTLGLAARTDGAAFTVEDHGRGIPEADRARIFERFYRVDKAHGAGGTGLGLAIVKHVAELHHGSISFAVPPEGGSRFTLAVGF